MSATANHIASGDHSVSEALGLWEPKRTLTLEAARRHTDRVRRMRYVLMILAVAMIILLAVQFVAQPRPDILEDDPTESVKMVNPRYSGRTGDGLPFYLPADTATRRLADRDLVELDKPVLEFIRESGMESSFVVAKSGTYNDVKKILELVTDVNLETDDGYACQTTHARVFAQDKRIEGDAPIACQGNFGTVDGTTYTIEDNYRTFVFKDGMTALIKQDSESGDGNFAFGGDGPIDVKAIEGTYAAAETRLRGDVRVKQDGAVMTSTDMDIFRAATGETDTGSLRLGAVERIVARGDFHYVTADTDVRGDRGVYVRDKKAMTVTGDVRVRQSGGNTARSDRLIYNTETRAVRFSGDCQGEDCGRTSIVIPGSGN